MFEALGYLKGDIGSKFQEQNNCHTTRDAYEGETGVNHLMSTKVQDNMYQAQIQQNVRYE